MNSAALLHNAMCGALAAAGFGVLFNVAFRALTWCAASGAFALAVRTIALALGWSMEAASFFAALAVGFAALLLPRPTGLSRGALQVVGCIPLIPGAFAAKAILGLFAVSTHEAGNENEILIAALANALRVLFTIGALGTGLAIPTMLLHLRGNSRPRGDPR